MYCNLFFCLFTYLFIRIIIFFNLFFLDVVNLFNFPFKMWSNHTACLE